MQQILNAILIGLIVFLVAYIYCTMGDESQYDECGECMYTPADATEEDAGNIIKKEKRRHENTDDATEKLSGLYAPSVATRRVHFDDANIISTDDSMSAVDAAHGGEWDSMSIEDVWDAPMNQDDKEEAKIKKMIKETLRDDVAITEDNINGEVSDKVKSAYSAPRAGEIRSSQAKARDLVPEMTSNKVDGNIDFAMAYMYAGRGPNTKLSGEGNAEWGVTDAYMHQKAMAYENGL